MQARARLMGLVWMLGACSPSEEAVQADFDAIVSRSNQCQTRDECTLIPTDCPLGCRRAVRADRAASVERDARALIADYERWGTSCEYDCTAAGEVLCEAGRCAEGEPANSQDCTAIGCGFAFSVQFKPVAPWPAGHYRVRVNLDGRDVECAADVPLSCDAAPACADENVLLGLSGCALPAENHAILGVDLQEPASSVSIEVSDLGGVLAQGQWQPQYVTHSPNGAGCDPACVTAPADTLAVHLPTR